MNAQHLFTASFFAFASLFLSPAFAATKTITLAVPGMYCAVCPITVRKALENVPGVSKATASLEKKEAVVTYDDTKTKVENLLDATFEAGYPSTVKGAQTK
ncbi:mercury resistance system periplasmic binding protein MerP [Sulfuriferula sp.]|uniref:mercury resistance system periplasmic binding protein MerP n=1 Tax=Sulfuriferula sp. TaxID=2025307 RepID=UPI0027301428|nr:mercury resistance system periplasmic binding protein MerP [Sulfuriferula sp.]MDP2026518.1 mercury resistance system periplasmic binding protein MerP [Sulfuriferula sp.]